MEDKNEKLIDSFYNGNVEDTIIAINQGADVNTPDIYGRYTPCLIASQEGHDKVVSVLIAAGEDVNKPDNNNGGYTPCYIASYKGHDKAVSVLIAAGADVNIPDNDGWTPCYIACYKGHDKVVSVLIAAGADANKPNND